MSEMSALRSSAEEAIAREQSCYVAPSTLKGVISESHPTPPNEVDSYYRYVFGTQAPVVRLCLVDDHVVEDWSSFSDERLSWFKSLTDAPYPRDEYDIIPLYSSVQSYLVLAAGRIYGSRVWKEEQHQAVYFSSGSAGCYVGSPDMVAFSNKQPVIVGVMDIDPTSRVALGRLYSYLLLTGCSFGVVSSCIWNVYCMKLEDRLLVSQAFHHMEAPMMGIGFILQKALKMNEEKLQQIILPPTLSLASLHLSYARDVFGVCCREQRVLHAARMIQDLGSVSTADLKDVRFLYAGAATNLIRGLLKGRKVVVKIKDLSVVHLDYETINGSLGRSVREVDVYMRLHRIQGIHIPRLISYGFIRGGMIFYIIMSDEGDGVGLRGWFPSNLSEVDDAFSHARRAVLALHDRGVVYNGFHQLRNLVVSVDSKAQLHVKLVGFENSLVGKDRRTWSEMDSDLTNLKECKDTLNELCQIRAAQRT